MTRGTVVARGEGLRKSRNGHGQGELWIAYQASFAAVEAELWDPTSWYQLGVAIEDLAWGAYDESEEAWRRFLFQAVCTYAQAAGCDPSWWKPYYRAGVLWELLGRQDKAIAYGSRSLRCGTSPPEAHHAWIEIMVRAGRFAKVAERYQAALSSNPDDLWPYLFLGYAYQCQAYELFAEELLVWALESLIADSSEKAPPQSKDKFTQVQDLLGLAKGHYRLAAEKYPNCAEPLYYLGCLLSDPVVGTVEEAETAIKAALDRFQDDHPLMKPILDALEALSLRNE